MTDSTPNLDPSHLVTKGWETFKRRPGLCIALWFVFSLLSGSGGNASSQGQGADGDVAVIILIVAGLLALVGLLIGGPMRGGYGLAMLRLVRGDDSVTFGSLFDGFGKFLPLFLTFLLFGVVMVVGLALCVVPGVILGLGLWPVFLIVMERDLPPVDALKAAWALTLGHKVPLFVLALVSGLIGLLGVLACGVGLFVAGPVISLAWAAAYDELSTAA